MKDTTTDEKDTQQNAKAPESDGNAPEVETFTKAQLDEAIQKDRIARGREEKALKEREARVTSWEQEQAERKRRDEEAEEEKLRSNPDALKAMQERRKINAEAERIKAERAALEQDKTSHAERLTRAEKVEQELNVWKAAQTSGVDANALMEKCAKFKLTAEEDIKDMAETMAAAGGEKKPELHVDSSKGKGGKLKLGDLPPKDRVNAADQALRKK